MSELTPLVHISSNWGVLDAPRLLLCADGLMGPSAIDRHRLREQVIFCFFYQLPNLPKKKLPPWLIFGRIWHHVDGVYDYLPETTLKSNMNLYVTYTLAEKNLRSAVQRVKS